MIEHKKRVIFYPMQLRDFVRDHGAELPIGISVAYDTIKPERYCIVRPNRFRFYHELCGANGLPLNFFISMRHIFTGASPVFYASARAELMRMGEHPMFTLFLSSCQNQRRIPIDHRTRFDPNVVRKASRGNKFANH